MLSARPGPLNPGAVYLLQHHPMRPSRAAGSFFGPTAPPELSPFFGPSAEKQPGCKPHPLQTLGGEPLMAA